MRDSRALLVTSFIFLSSFATLQLAEAASGKEEFDKATKFFEAEEYESALPLFQQAYTLSNRRPSTIRALAQCERALRMFDEALLHFKEYLATKPEDAQAIRETIALLEEQRAAKLRDDEKAAAAAAEQKKQRELAEAERNKRDEEARKAEAERLDAAVKKAEAAERTAELAKQTAETAAPQETSLLSNPLFWGAIALVVAGGVTGAILLSGQEADPIGGSTGIVVPRAGD